MSVIYGYARVSSVDQDLTLQEDTLRAAGATLILKEKKSGTTTEGREELSRLLDFVREGDTIIITRIDRLARSIGDLSAIVDRLKAKGVSLKATEQPIDTSTPTGKAFLQMLGVFAKFETAIRKERQLEGIAKAKKEGVYKGRKATVDGSKINELVAAGKGPTEIAKMLGIGRATVYRYLMTKV